MEQKPTNLDTIQRWREEIQGYWEEMVTWEHSDDIQTILRKISAMHARVGHMRSVLVRSTNKQVMDFRTKEVDKFLDALEFQHKNWSRIGGFAEKEWSMSSER